MQNLRTSQGYIFPFTTFRDQILEFYYFWKFFSEISFFLPGFGEIKN